MKKHLNHLFISIIVVLLGAISSVVPVYAGSDVSVKYYASRTPTLQMAQGCPSLNVSSAYCLNNNTDGRGAVISNTNIYWGSGIPVEKGQILEVIISVYNVQDNNSLDSYTTRMPSTVSGGGMGYYYMGATYEQLSASAGVVKYLWYIGNASTIYQIQFPSAWIELKPSEAFSVDSVIVWDINVAQSGGSGTVQDYTQVLNDILVQISWTRSAIVDLQTAITSSQQQTVEAINNINNDQTEAGEQAQAEAQAAADTAGSDAEQNTATMFSTLGDIVGVFKDTPAGDCTININFGQGKPNLGNLNFCQGDIEPIRPVIRAVIYLAMAVGTYKLLMWVIGAIAGLINWVQTGNGGGSE